VLKIVRNVLILSFMILIGVGCMGNKVNPLEYKKHITKKVRIPESCKNEYKSVMPKVAVVNFTNNSTFGKADITNIKGSSKTTKNAVGAVGIGISPVGIGAVGASHSTRKTKF